ncbi:hypothetical protein FQN54_000901 [Arachnomyces sp. PD_36]|nr:hypothetical protein FQN54_000901 [Arachnomyces sp. PD_36]
MLFFARQPAVLWTGVFVILVSCFSRAANASWKFHPNELTFETRQDTNGTLPPCALSFTTDVWTGCRDVLRQFWITLEYFRWANPGKFGEDCSGFVPGETYCVKRPSSENGVVVSQNGLCGASQNWTVTCVGSEGGDCCGSGGYCGSGEEYCAPGNCQEGACEGDVPYSTDGKCGRGNRHVECPPKFGACCSRDGFCGDTDEFCGEGCQSGDCLSSTPSPTSTSPPAPTLEPGSVSEDGTCGYKRKYICQGSTFGDCCSAAGYCGSNKYFCSDLLGCQPEFGTCDETVTTTTAA